MSLCVSASASKAVDSLLDSKWAKAKKGEEALFTTRESVVDYCNRLATNLTLTSMIYIVTDMQCCNEQLCVQQISSTRVSNNEYSIYDLQRTVTMQNESMFIPVVMFPLL